MATVKSTTVTNLDASPAVRDPGHRDQSWAKESRGVAATSATQAAADIIHFCRVPSNARVSQVLLTNRASTAGAIDVGLYSKSADGTYAAVDVDLFASAASLIAAQNNVDITHESGEYTIEESEKQLWEVLGLSSDPSINYFISATVTTTFVAGTTAIGVSVRFSQ